MKKLDEAAIKREGKAVDFLIEENIRVVESDIVDYLSHEASIGGEAMDDAISQLEKVNKIRLENNEANRKKKKDRWEIGLKIAGLFASIGTFLLMLKQEITGSFRSKGLTWFWDIFKKTN